MIRAATPADTAAIAGLESRLFGSDAWTPQQVADELTGPGRQTSVAVDGQVVGYVVTMLVGDVVDLLRIGVDPGRRREGWAGRLLEQALTRPASRMLLEVSETNAEARALYAAHGFEEIHRRPGYYRDGSNALVLQLTLPGTMAP